MIDEGDPKPIYYPLERDGMKKNCQNFYPGPLFGTAIDKRYSSILTDLYQPDMYAIQSNSGVYSKLINMPSYSNYNPNAVEEKSALLYSFMGRPNIYYDPACASS